MFPHRREMPGIGAMWTTNGKAMYILKHRCEVEIRKLARDKFRLVSPPLYECRHCHCVCFLGCEIRHHRKYCQYNEDVDDQPNYVAWRLAEPVVEGALAPLKKHYGKQKNHLRNMQTKSNLQYLKSLQSFHWEKTPAKPLKFARSKSYKGISSIKLSKLPSREAGGISRASSIRSGITFNGALSPTPRPRGSSASDNNKFMNNSFYGSVQSVSDHDEEETAAGMSTSRSAIMKQHGAKLLTSGGSKAPPGVMGLSGKTYAKGSLSSPSMYRLKSQKLLANAIFSDGSTTKVQDRYHEDLFDDDEPEDGQETTNHDENVDDWY